jgi:hypothetical protein
VKKNENLPSMSGGAGGGSDNIASVIINGITFKAGGGKGPKREEQGKVKTKAKKKQYITGAHGSGSAKMKADIRRKRANRHK